MRWETTTDKQIRPVLRSGDRWLIGGMPEPRPLYRLPELADADRVYVTEGEKAADAVRSLGLAATTSAHGSKSAAKTNWSPLAGKESVVLPDNDEAGESYANTVREILSKLSPMPDIKVVVLTGLPEHGDIVDWINARKESERDDLKCELERLADEADPREPDTFDEPLLAFQPFPLDVLPQPLKEYVEQASKVLGCDPAFIGGPVLCVCAAAIGNTRVIRLKRTWNEPAILWICIVGESGSMKSPSLDLVLQPVRKLQSRAMADYEEELRQDRSNVKVRAGHGELEERRW